MNQEKMGKFIAERRKAVNLTQKSLSEKLNVNEKTVSKWERGINAPDITLLTNLAEILEITVNELLSGEKEDRIDNNDKQIAIEGIKFYNKMSKFKYLKLFVTILIIVILIFAAIFTINNFNQFKVYNVSSDNSDYDIEGYVIFNQEKNIIFLKPIIYNDKYVGTSKEIKTDEVKVEVLLEDKVIYKEVKKETNSKTLSDILNSIVIFVEEDNKNHEYIINTKDDLTKLTIEMTYTFENEQLKVKIPLNVENIYSNNKLFY